LTVIVYSFFIIFSFLLGFITGNIFSVFHKGKIKTKKKKENFKVQDSLSMLNEEYKNFLSYEGYEQ